MYFVGLHIFFYNRRPSLVCIYNRTAVRLTVGRRCQIYA